MQQYDGIQHVKAILQAAAGDICELASEVGIDGRSLLQQLLMDDCFIKGRAVPVLSSGYKGRCYVLFRVFRNRSGECWPYLQFFTFRHGGLQRVFNGWRWLHHHRHIVEASLPDIKPCQTNPLGHRVAASQEDDNRARQRRHASLLRRYNEATPLSSTHPWVKRRFPGINGSKLWGGSGVRVCGAQLLVPIENSAAEIVGFHEITLGAEHESKRHYVKYAGAMKGAFVKLPGLVTGRAQPPIICEGLATGLTLALCSGNSVYVSLSSVNLKRVRLQLTGEPQVIFCYDNDQWHPEAGNTGYRAARQASQHDDLLCGPHFSQQDHWAEPSDFNDLHQLHGLGEVERQLAESMP